MVAFSLLLAQVRVEVLKWIIAVLTPVAPILAIAGKGSPGLAATMVSPAAHGLAALAVFIARLTEHPELMC